MPTFQLLQGARGLDFEGGGSLRADKRGRVQVSEETAAAIRSSAAMHRYDAIVEVAPGRYASGRDEPTCDCGFAPWPWHRTCPRCGAVLVEA